MQTNLMNATVKLSKVDQNDQKWQIFEQRTVPTQSLYRSTNQSNFPKDRNNKVELMPI